MFLSFLNVFSFIYFASVQAVWISLHGLETQIIYLAGIPDHKLAEKKNKWQTLSTGTFCLC